MILEEFTKEVEALSPRFSIILNPNRPGLANILFDGVNYDLPAISAIEIKDLPDTSHRYEFPNGASVRLWAKDEILERLHSFLVSFESNKELYEPDEDDQKAILELKPLPDNE